MRVIGFFLMLSAVLLAAILQWRGLLFTRHVAPKVTSVVEYTKADGTIVHATSVEAHSAQVHWWLATPIGIVFIMGAALVSFNKSK